MSKWTFKAVKLGANRKVKLVALDPEQEKKIKIYEEALVVANQSVVANPSFSKYFVKESVSSAGNPIMPAGNIEYGICQALHGEESAVAVFRSVCGRESDKNIVLGIIAGQPGNIASPCGNCRDIMLEDFGKDFEIVSGAPEGGVAVVAKMKDYLFDNFSELKSVPASIRFQNKVTNLIGQGELLVNDAYSPKSIHPERRYYAAIFTNENEYDGAHDVMCDYHPIYALRDAVRQARRAKDPFVRSVLIVGENFGINPPHVMYKDRQHLLELNLQQELLLGKEKNPSVYLAAQYNYNITRVWKTKVKEWLPLAFNPRNFGPEFIAYLTDYFKRR